MKNYAIFTERELIVMAQQGDNKAMEQLISLHNGFLKKEAQKYKTMYRAEFDDMYQEACDGFIHAVRSFDVLRDNNLLSYAVWKIKDRVGKYAWRCTSISIPYNAVQINILTNKARMKFVNEVGCEPTDEELSEMVAVEVGCTPSHVKDVLSFRAVNSFDEYDDCDDGFSRRDSLEFIAQQADMDDDVFCSTETMELLYECIDRLPEVERMVICGKFDLCGKKNAVNDMAVEMGVSTETIRKIKVKALSHLKEMLTGRLAA